MNFLKIILLIVFQISFSQTRNHSVSYNLILNDDYLFSNGSLKEYYTIAQNGAKYVQFELKFNDTLAEFNRKDLLKADISASDLNFTLSFANYFGKKIQTPNFFITNMSWNGKKYLVKSNPKIQWTLTDESKVIDKYLCYKATTIYKVENDKGVFNHPVIAWYCPELPFNYGPNGYGGLPGLILELQERNVLFGAEIIEINKENLTFSNIELEKAITEEEFNKILSKNLEK